jgi:hypothetical protein
MNAVRSEWRGIENAFMSMQRFKTLETKGDSKP